MMHNFQTSDYWMKTAELVAWKIIVPKSAKHTNHSVFITVIYYPNQLVGTQNLSFVILYRENVSGIFY